MKKKINEKEIKKVIKKTLAVIGIEDDFEISMEDKTINVVLNTEDKGILIGYHGDTLDALQLILSLCLSRQTGEFMHVSLEVGDYKKNREEFLRNLATRTKEKVLEEKRECSLSNLKSWERRVVHLFFQDDNEVVSESVGEGQERVLVVKPR